MARIVERTRKEYEYKQDADKITQLLDKIRNLGPSDKRWVWELMQNAKDVPNQFGGVSIKISLWQDKLVFSHNGNCFTVLNLYALIRQISSKDSANEGEQRQTGKFGSGFITTHLLSDKINVSGIVHNTDIDKYQKFTLLLDRSARKSEDLMKNIKVNLEWLDGLDNDDFDSFPIIEGYDQRNEESFDTSFDYPLINEDSLHSAIVGLDDLVNTLPITMVSLPEIKSVMIENHIEGTKQHYICTSETLLQEKDRLIIKSCVDINGEKKFFLTYKTFREGVADVALSIEVRIGEGGIYELVARDKNQPVLFRDFPLIGSEKFYFPYMLNGFDFEPTETRSGLLLNRNEEKPKKNRAIIERAINATLSFNEWLLSEKVHNTYLMASSREPKPEESWDENYAKPWIKTQMENWHKALLEQKLLETKNGYVVLSQIKIPCCGNKEANKKFYEFLSDFKISGQLPLREQQEEWAKTISWAEGVKVSIDNFLDELQRIGNVVSLSERLGKSEKDTYVWLNDLYKFIKEQGDIELLNNYPIVPNQYGNFWLLNKLSTDSAQRIPNQLKDITTEILERDLRDELLAESIDDSIFTIKEFRLDNLIHEVNKKITSAIQSKISVSSGEWNIVSKCVYNIIAIYTNDEEKEKRDVMYEFVSHFADNISERQCVNDLPTSLWSEVDRFVITFVPYLIESSATTIDELGTKLLCSPNVHSEDECINWLNNYKQVSQKYGIEIPSSMKIYPNQKGELKPLSTLHRDKGIPSALIDLNRIATGEDWREKMLNRRLEGFEMHDPLGTADIYEEVKKVFESKDVSDKKKIEIAREAIILNPGSSSSDKSDNVEVHDFLMKLDKELPNSQVIEDANGFSWEIFVAYILRDVCKRIAESENIHNLSKLICEDEDRTIDFVDSVLSYTMNCYGKRYKNFVLEEYGLWVNQNGNFCIFGDISQDDGVDGEIKKLAKNPIVDIDYKELLLRKELERTFLLIDKKLTEHKIVTTEVVLKAIDEQIKVYDKDKHNSLQVPDFASLVINLKSMIDSHPVYATSLTYFDANKDRLIVGSIGDPATLSFVGSIVSSPEKLELMQHLYKLPLEHLEKMSRGEYVAITAEELAKYYSGIDTNTLPTMQLDEDDSLTQDEQIRLNEEARMVALAFLKDNGFDTTNIQENFSLVDGVKMNDDEFPLVVKSYKNSTYQFRLNPNEWYQLMRSTNSMLLVYRGDSEIGVATFSNLFKNQDKMSLQFSLEALGSYENLTKFASILQYFKGCHFNFSNLLTTRYESMQEYRKGQKNPNAFIDLSPDDKKFLN